MKKNTVEEAVIKVLKHNSNGLTAKEIYDKIIGQKLYQFNTKEPLAVVSHTIRKSCVGVNIGISKDEKNKVFKMAGNGKYTLKED